MKHSYLLAGIKINHLIRLVKRNGLSYQPKYLIRFLFLLQGGFWASFLTSLEKKRFGNAVKDLQLPDNPIFIIGHWRTGSTFLHQLLNLDKQLSAPSVFQVSAPDSFLVSGRYYKPIMTRMLDPVRPMDQVKLGFDEPQEDEYAILKMGLHSPLEQLIFPKNNGYFLSDFSTNNPDESQEKYWRETFQTFYKKLTFQSGKRIVFKNPFHSLRINLLREMFPKAYFIYIYRNPFVVIPSTQRMWRIVGRQNNLLNNDSDPPFSEVVSVYKKMTHTIKEVLNSLPKSCYSEVKFETFEKDPMQTLKILYEKMGLTFSSKQEEKIMNFLTENINYRKNKYTLSVEEANLIADELHDELEKDDYKNPL